MIALLFDFRWPVRLHLICEELLWLQTRYELQFYHNKTSSVFYLLLCEKESVAGSPYYVSCLVKNTVKNQITSFIVQYLSDVSLVESTITFSKKRLEE